uniref:Uncharacterized protein n=1 Tax=Arundo donax TaxID=35708 RepID=A0A0A9ACE7_ARUDO
MFPQLGVLCDVRRCSCVFLLNGIRVQKKSTLSYTYCNWIVVLLCIDIFLHTI